MAAITPGIRSQLQLDDRIVITGTIASGGTAQLVLKQQPRRMTLEISNNHASALLTAAIGPAIGHATISNGAVTGITVDNGGLGYTLAPQIVLLGGLIDGDYANAPSHPATAHTTLSSGVVQTPTIDDGGAGYVVAPLVYFMNPLPALGGGAYTPSATVGIPIAAGTTYQMANGLLVPGSAIALFGGTTGQAYTVTIGGLC